jgi:type I restriction enzyme S subunit
MEMNAIPEGFKMTELGPLPEEWTVVPLQKLNAKKKISLNPSNFPDEIFEYYSIPNYQNSRILFGKLNPRVEKVWKVESDTQHRKIGSTEWIPIFPDNEKVDSNFLYYVEWSKYVMPIAKTLVTGSTPSRQRVPPASFYEIEIPLPTLHEQRAIASVLSAVHEAKEKTEAVITATKELKKSLMKHLFTYGPASLEEAENVPLKETEIGMVPEEWDVVMLENVVKKTEQKDPRKTPECQFKYIDVSSINREDLKIVEYKLYKGKDAPSRAKKLVKNSDVIFATVRPTLRRFTLIEEDFNGEICSTAFCVLRAKESFLSSLYVLYVVQRDIFIDELRKIQRGASYPAVTDSDVKNQKIPLPPPSIQQKITSILSAVDEKIEKEETKKKSMEELFKTLLHNLMTGKLRVNHLEV